MTPDVAEILNVKCPGSCLSYLLVLYKERRLMCGVKGCTHYGIQYKIPTVPLERADDEEQKS